MNVDCAAVGEALNGIGSTDDDHRAAGAEGDGSAGQGRGVEGHAGAARGGNCSAGDGGGADEAERISRTQRDDLPTGRLGQVGSVDGKIAAVGGLEGGAVRRCAGKEIERLAGDAGIDRAAVCQRRVDFALALNRMTRRLGEAAVELGEVIGVVESDGPRAGERAAAGESNGGAGIGLIAVDQDRAVVDQVPDHTDGLVALKLNRRIAGEVGQRAIDRERAAAGRHESGAVGHVVRLKRQRLAADVGQNRAVVDQCRVDLALALDGVGGRLGEAAV